MYDLRRPQYITNVILNKKTNCLQGIENAYQTSQSGSHHQQQPHTHQSYGNISNQQIHYHNSQHSPPNNALHGSHGNLTNLGNVSKQCGATMLEQQKIINF